MPRFNIICHGMMLFVDEGQDIRILMPRVDAHEYAFGNPEAENETKPCGPYPGALPLAEYTLKGPSRLDDPKPLSGLFDCNKYLMLRKEQFDIVPDDGVFRLWIPKPAEDVVLLRPVPRTTDLIGTGTPKEACLKHDPDYVHDVVVFTYEVDEGTEITIAPWYKGKVGADWLNLCLYSQTGRSSTNAALVKARLRKCEETAPHPTGLNDLLRMRVGGKRPTLALSRIGCAAGPKAYTKLGIGVCQLKSLMELAYPKELRIRTDPGGCAGAGVSEGGG